ncbi:putative membrane protein [Photobacterium sp. SKA34]|uniref:MAPEG family protein n=1 Tax=Photobacterium sp. SKA34 TaxID=121723 RepID=UPI00006AF7D1|nr:MAPEG family protein [Photobacterium sp. SKA34]EAR54932.1 putative membrane protein [Photobacterium sp. SKA34]
MDILIYSLIAAALLPYIAKIPLAVAMHKAGGYDNNHPREQQAKLDGFGARALAAHQNAFESLIIFAMAVLLAIATSTTNENIQFLALLHIGFRVIYHILYLTNHGILRSISWTIAISCSFIIMGQCLSS